MLLVGSLLFVLIGFFMEHLGSCAKRAGTGSMYDFKAVYYSSRCLLQHCDPYNESEMLHFLLSDSNAPTADPNLRSLLQGITLCVYMPATFILIAPFALLAWGPAHVLWMVFIAGSFVLAAYLMWNLGANYAPVLSGALIAWCAVNSFSLLHIGNAAGIAVGLCTISVWCFLKDRFVPAGILCLMISLAIKPHDSGLVWLFFMLAGGAYRKRALQTAVVAAVLCLPAILWVSQVAPDWMLELHSNLVAVSSRGSVNDPGLNPLSPRTAGMVIDLQTVVSVFRDDPRFYNPVTYVICGIPMLLWSVTTLRGRSSTAKAWLALAAIVPLTLLVTYHRPYDAKLLLLTVPACAMLWAEGGLIGWLGLVVNTVGFAMTGDIPLALLVGSTKGLHPDISRLSGQMQYIVLLRPVPLILLGMSAFYLWIYVRRSFSQSLSAATLARCGEAENAGKASA